MTETPNTDNPESVGGRKHLPFTWLIPLLAGALAGVALRLIFSGNPGAPYASAMGAFIYLSPLFVGAVTVYVAETRQRRTWGYYIRASFLANLLYVSGTMLVLMEGLVCAAVVLPLFSVLGVVGGLIMGVICRVTNWPKHALMSIGILPVILGSVEARLPLPDRVGMVERTVTINAPPGVIWKEILNATDIRPDEVGRAWAYRIGVPVPLSGVAKTTPSGTVRRVTMGKGIYFDQVITRMDEPNRLSWAFRFYPDSFPPHTLDDHVVIGGHYFDLIDASYTLVPNGSSTDLRVQMHYRVSTRFNWYANPLARFLLGNVEEVNLEYYRRRSESKS